MPLDTIGEHLQIVDCSTHRPSKTVRLIMVQLLYLILTGQYESFEEGGDAIN